MCTQQTAFNIMSRIWVAIDVVWIGNWKYCTLTESIAPSLIHALYSSLQYLLSLSLLYLHRLSRGNCFKRSSFLNFRAHALTGRRLSQRTKLLDIYCLQHLGTDRIVNTVSNSSSIVVSRSCCTDRLENTASQLVLWCVLGFCYLSTSVVCRVIT
jgi:hypothetical protein